MAKCDEIDENSIKVLTFKENFFKKFQQDNNVVLSELNGNFPLWIDLYGFPEMKDEEIAGFFVQNAGVDVLISDASVNPYQWTLFANNTKYQIHVNCEFLDEEDGFIIDKIISQL